jgi:hypothetical protein
MPAQHGRAVCARRPVRFSLVPFRRKRTTIPAEKGFNFKKADLNIGKGPEF